MTSTCPNDDLLGALIQHALSDREAAVISAHVDDCDTCREAVIAAVRSEGTARRAPSHDGSPAFAHDAEPRTLVGARMGRYQLQELLGSGGMGQVYRAYDSELDRTIALKVLRPELARKARVLADRLIRESRIMAMVAHPAVITVYDVGREGGAVFIAMELVRGETLAAYLARARPAWTEIAAIFERAGHGLAAAHDAGLVHRDFKPDNVLVESNGTTVTKVVVTDFGIATAALAAAAPSRTEPTPDGTTGRPSTPARAPTGGSGSFEIRLTTTGAALGTPAYMAPEQFDGASVDRRADVFAFSVSLWEALFGERPFPGRSLHEIRTSMLEAPRRPSGDVPRRIVQALRRGLVIDPAKRLPDLRPLLAELSPERARRRNRLVAMTAGAVALVAGGVGIALALTSSRADACTDRAAWIESLPSLPDADARRLVDGAVAAWRTTHASSCDAERDPPQAAAVAACLDARRREIAALAADLTKDPGAATEMADRMIDPARCATAPPGLMSARVPEDLAAQRVVGDLRARAREVKALRDAARYAEALPRAKGLVDEAATAWPPIQAELRYLLGEIQVLGGASEQGTTMLRDAAAMAERVHHDEIAALAWMQLVQSSMHGRAETARTLEYATYADAALDRLGRPPALEARYQYVKGLALLENGRPSEGETAMRRGLEIATASVPELVAQAHLGVAYALEHEGQYDAAVKSFRTAIEELARTRGQRGAHTYYEGLARSAMMLGDNAEARTAATRAIEIADATLGADNVGRAISRTVLAQILERTGELGAALREIRDARAIVARVNGERDERFAEILWLEAGVLGQLGRSGDAVQAMTRACEIVAFRSGERSAMYGQCLLEQAVELSSDGKGQRALELVERALGILLEQVGEKHPNTANARLVRGALYQELGRTQEAVPELERAVAAFQALPLDVGHLGGAKLALAEAVARRDPERARELGTEAISLFDQGAGEWATSKQDAEKFLRSLPAQSPGRSHRR